jgi:pyruvoyl-dependent arginine decarboxylase (PvlArgDC)
VRRISPNPHGGEQLSGIENFNVMFYTSVLPPEGSELPHLPGIHHGSVLEGIIAVQHTISDTLGVGKRLPSAMAFAAFVRQFVRSNFRSTFHL